MSANEQKAIDIELVEDVGDLLVNSEELISASTNFGTSENKVIYDLLTAWQSASEIKQKQKLQALLKDELDTSVYNHEQLFSIIADMLCPSLVKPIEGIDESDDFYNNFFTMRKELEDSIISGNTDVNIIVDTDYLDLFELPLEQFKISLNNFEYTDPTLLPSELTEIVAVLADQLNVVQEIKKDIKALAEYPLNELSSQELRNISVTSLQSQLEALCEKVEDLEQLVLIDTGYESAFETLMLEDQLLAEIKAIDVNKEFYYNAPVMSSFSLDFNESTKSLNTLMNPQMNYDINNINNSFVISKLDIDFLDSGIQIARSSRLN